MSFDPEFDDGPFGIGKGTRKGARRRGTLVVVATIGAVLAASTLVTSLLVPSPSPEPATLAAPPQVVAAPAEIAPSTQGSLPYHLIVNRETGQCLDVPYGDKGPRTRVEQFPVNGGGNQLWRMETVPGDGVRIVNRHSEMCLDIPYGTPEPQVAVEQFPANGGSNQGWRLEAVGDHWYRIVNQHTGRCLEVADGSREPRGAIVQAPPGESNFQHWRPIAVR